MSVAESTMSQQKKLFNTTFHFENGGKGDRLFKIKKM